MINNILALLLFSLSLVSCTDQSISTFPAPSPVKGSEDMWLPVGDKVHYTYQRVAAEPDTFTIIKTTANYIRNLQEFTGSHWQVTMPRTPVYAFGYTPQTAEFLINDFFGSINGVGFHEDSSGKSTVLSISDFVTSDSEVDVIRLPQHLAKGTKVEYADDGRFYEVTERTVLNTYWGETQTTVIRIGSEKDFREFFFVPGKGITRCNIYREHTHVNSYVLIDVH